MKIILAPAKKMREDSDSFSAKSKPQYIEKAQEILNVLKSMTFEELKAVWNCNDKIAEENEQRIKKMDLKKSQTPAIFSYDGIAFQYMAPSVFSDSQLLYIENNLVILSGLYGALKPFDAVSPYRLEMQSKIQVGKSKDLYEFWGDSLYRASLDESRTIINLASKEYYKCVEKYLTPDDKFIDCFFVENVNGKLKQKATFAKMARGEMVRFLAETNAKSPEKMKDFNRLNFSYRQDLSTDTKYVFERKPQNKI